MIRKKSLIVTLLILIGFIIYNIIKLNITYSKNIDSNWNINLPSTYTQVYPSNKDNSFKKTSKRYHIFKYDDDANLDSLLDWQIKDNSFLENSLTEMLNTMDIPKEFMPAFQCDYKYFIKKKNDSSIIYILFVKEYNILYIIEDFKS